MEVQFRKKSQITLPMNIVQQLELKEGDKLGIKIVNQTICLTPLDGTQKGNEIEVIFNGLEKQIEKNDKVQTKRKFQKSCKLYFECFGHFAIYQYGELVFLSNKKAEELTALLICERGCPILKETLAALLWPKSEKKQSMECLYKVWQYICKLSERGIVLPIVSERNHMYFDPDDCHIDLEQFELYYENREDILSCEEAIQLYSGPLYYQECYDWISQWEAYYDIRFWKLLENTIEYYQTKENWNIVEKYNSIIANYEFE